MKKLISAFIIMLALPAYSATAISYLQVFKKGLQRGKIAL